MPQPTDKTKVKEWKAKISNTLKGRRCCMRTEWAKGHIPHNKGTVGLMKANSGSFRKGNKPQNYMGGIKMSGKDGLYIKDGNKTYKYGNITTGKYESLARHNWKEKFGKISKGMIIFHKDDDILNNDIDNLELITRKELLRRNKYKRIRTCFICGLDFRTRSGNQKTCSKKCHNENERLLNQEWINNNREKMNNYNKKYKLRKLNEYRKI